jgi:transcriptional/translational regulatory protein YebC/TACO1
MFDKKGLFIIEKVATIDEEELMMLSLEAGADDFKVEDNEFEITVEPDLFYSFQEVLEKNGIKTSVAEITMIPQTTVALVADDATRMMKLMDALEEHDDIQEVYANFDIPEDLM